MNAQTRIACFDLSGTLLEHEELRRPVPLMPAVLDGLAERGWGLKVLTRTTVSYAGERLDAADVELPAELMQVESKREALEEVLEDETVHEVLFVDDNPRSVDAISQIDDDRLRVLGIVGSGKYCPELSIRCAQFSVQVALSAPDLAAILSVPLAVPEGEVDFTTEEWASLMRGLADPVAGGQLQETGFPEAWPLEGLRARPEWWAAAWPQIGWVANGAGVWKLLVDSVLEAADLREEASDAADWEPQAVTEWLGNLSGGQKMHLQSFFAKALESLIQGIARIGAEAELCRPAGLPLQRDRVEATFDHLESLYGTKAWLTNARGQLQETRARTLSS